MPILSIIIPTFNSSLFIESALESISSQEFTNYEIWIIDGSSSDNTIEIVRSFQVKNNRIKFISEPDKGIYDAMNKGVALAEGTWLYFMGSDDRLYNTTVLSAVFNDAVLCNNNDVLYGNVVSTKFEGNYAGKFTDEKLFNQNICHQAIFMRRKLFDVTGNFDLRFRSHADWDHNIKWFSNPGVRKTHVDMVIAAYGANGFSSQHDDPAFENNKLETFIARIDKFTEPGFRSFLYAAMASKMKSKKNLSGYFKYKLKSIFARHA